MKLTALLLITLGVVGLVFGGIGYTRQTTVFDVGGIRATADEQQSIPIAPILAAASLSVGVALLLVRRRTAGRTA